VLDDPRFDVTRTGVVSGTPGTMSPEVILGEPASPASDVYALGAVFYLLLTGEMPFAGEGSATLVAHVNEAVVPPSSRRGEPVPEDVEAIVMRCLAKKPGDRYENAAALARALKRCTAAGAWHPSLAPAPRRQHEDSEDHAPTRSIGRGSEPDAP
jgi:serine/threonine-protein kinase